MDINISCSGRLDAAHPAYPRGAGKRFGRKAQVRMKTQLLACVLNLSELVYDLMKEKTKTPTNSERPQEGQGLTDPERSQEGRGAH